MGHLSFWKIPASFVIMGLIIGTIFTWHFRTEVPVKSLFPADQLQARDALIKTLSDDQAVFQSRIGNLREQIDEQQQKNQTLLSRAKLSLLEESKEKIGLTSFKSSGIAVLLNDSPLVRRNFSDDANQDALVQASDLRDLINLLWTSGAEAIAINRQRVTFFSSISPVGPNILVDNFYMTPPFIIEAAGDPEFMQQRLLNPDTLTDLKKRTFRLGLDFEISPAPQIVVPPYTGNLRIQFLQPL